MKILLKKNWILKFVFKLLFTKKNNIKIKK